jgi:hypothetical protein
MVCRRLAVLLLLTAAAFPLGAASVSFLVMETGLPPDAGNSVYSGLWESGLLDVFFDAGHIVTNAQMVRTDARPEKNLPDEILDDIDEAVEGGMEFFILALLEYSGGEKPKSISLRVFSVKNHALLFERRFADTPSLSLEEEFNNVKKEARVLLPNLRNN